MKMTDMVQLIRRFAYPATAILLAGLTGIWISCNKPGNDPGNSGNDYKLSYGDSVIYLKPMSSDYVVFPTEQKAGTYSGFPEGIEINDVTGAINVSKSETGLRYRITHTDPNGKETVTNVVLSGITFPDRFYHLSQHDSIAFPVYNANTNINLPVSGSSFDEGNNANSGGCSVRTTDGQINLAQCIRNGVFGNNPQNDVRKDFDIFYRLNDASGKSLNKIRVRLYYYATMADVAPDLMQTLQDRVDQGVFFRSARTVGVAKPRPPCVIIVGQ